MNLATRRIYGCGCYARLGQGYSVRTEKDNLHKFLSLALFGPKKVFDGFESDMVRGQAYVAFQALERGSSSYEGSHMVTTSLKADWQINNDDALTFELERLTKTVVPVGRDEFEAYEFPTAGVRIVWEHGRKTAVVENMEEA